MEDNTWTNFLIGVSLIFGLASLGVAVMMFTSPMFDYFREGDKKRDCPRCHGQGLTRDEDLMPSYKGCKITCPKCEGKGILRRTWWNFI